MPARQTVTGELTARLNLNAKRSSSIYTRGWSGLVGWWRPRRRFLATVCGFSRCPAEAEGKTLICAGRGSRLLRHWPAIYLVNWISTKILEVFDLSQ
ncbi:hypothetical protein BaRGS_00008060 [Batillaria attramentaria]|uniref:Uncharacterized protein n=1 Tax=Batillaria attramentaria TaxID=370345 RepID=A0ABD0LMY9_9CAEN